MSFIKNVFLFAVFAFVLIANIECKNQAEDPDVITGYVVGITDGDTFTLLTKGNKQIKIRLYGIDCPEKKQDFGQAAKQKLSTLIFDKDVLAKKKDIDRYGRTVAIIYNENNTCINEVMLQCGLAWHYTRYDTNPVWDEMQNEARRNKIGLWSQPDPMAPWQWRMKKKETVQ